jgi:hypothetical protein
LALACHCVELVDDLHVGGQRLLGVLHLLGSLVTHVVLGAGVCVVGSDLGVLRCVGVLLTFNVLVNLHVNFVDLPDALEQLYLHHGLVMLQHFGLHLVGNCGWEWQVLVGTRVLYYIPRVALPMMGEPGLGDVLLVNVDTFDLDLQQVLRVLLRHVGLGMLDLLGEHLEELSHESSLFFLLLISLRRVHN